MKTTDEWMSWYNLVADRASDNLRARPEDIISAVCYLTRVRPEHLASKSRAQHISMARQLAMFIVRELTDLSFPRIGQMFGRDHTTVIHAHNVIRRRIERDRAFALTVERMLRGLETWRTAA